MSLGSFWGGHKTLRTSSYMVNSEAHNFSYDARLIGDSEPYIILNPLITCKGLRNHGYGSLSAEYYVRSY